MASNYPLRKLIDVVTPHRNTWTPARRAQQVALYSLPAFDATGTHEFVAEETIESGKNEIQRPVLLVSKLNPRFPRVLCACPVAGAAATVASPEFMAFETEDPDDLKFLKYSFLHPGMTDLMKSAASGTSASHQRVQQGSVLEMEVYWPDFSTRNEISSVLGAFDDLIENLHATNETLEAILQALFKSWFVDFDPVRAKASGRVPAGMDAVTAELFPSELEESELGPIPRGWRRGSLGVVSQAIRDGVPVKDLRSDIPYLGMEHMPRQSIALNEWGFADEVQSNKSRFATGDILFGKIRPYFHKVGIAAIDGVCSTDIAVIRPCLPEWYGFCLGHLSSTALIDYASQLSNGAKMPRVSWADLAAYPVSLPPSEVAHAFQAAVSPLLQKILANIHESRAVIEVRNALLPKLISGELRLQEFSDA